MEALLLDPRLLTKSPPPLVSSPFSGNRFPAINSHVSFLLPSQISTTTGSMRLPLMRVPYRTFCALNQFPMPQKENGHGRNKSSVMLGSTLVLACVLGIISCRFHPTIAMAGIPPRMSLMQLWNPNETPAQQLQNIKEKANKSKDDPLTTYLEEYGKAQPEGELARMLDRLIVDIQILKGKFQDALNRKYLEDEEEDDGKEVVLVDKRKILYKFLVHDNLNNKEEAKYWAQEFKNHTSRDGHMAKKRAEKMIIDISNDESEARKWILTYLKNDL